MGHIFISYVSSDKEFAIQLANELEFQGFYIWFDLFSIEAGQNWNELEKSALLEAEVILIILSNSNDGKSEILNKLAQMLEWLNKDDRSNRKSFLFVVSRISSNEIGKLADDIGRNARFQLFYADNSDYISKLIEALPASTKNPNYVKSIQNSKKPKIKGYIFVSYSNGDLDFTKKFREFFKKKGYAYWDYQESNRKYDMPFHLEIEEAIEGAEAIVSVVSPDWKASKWSTREYLFSEQLGKINFVCIVREVGATLLYADKTYIEFFKDESKGFELLDKALQREGLID